MRDVLVIVMLVGAVGIGAIAIYGYGRSMRELQKAQSERERSARRDPPRDAE